MADGVGDGLAGVAVSVEVTISVGVVVDVALADGVNVNATVEEILVDVTDGVMTEGVIGLGRKASTSTISRTIPIIMGMMCLRSAGGKNCWALS